MKSKTIIPAVSVLALVICMSVSAFAKTIVYQIDNPVMVVNGLSINVDSLGTMPIINSSRALVPLRSAVEAMDGKVDWDAYCSKITIELPAPLKPTVVEYDKDFEMVRFEGSHASGEAFFEAVNDYLEANPDADEDQLYAALEKIGIYVSYGKETIIFTISPLPKTIVMWIDNKIAYVNGEEMLLDVAPQIINDRTMVPVRFISENTGFSADWDANKKTISLYDGVQPETEFPQK